MSDKKPVGKWVVDLSIDAQKVFDMPKSYSLPNLPKKTFEPLDLELPSEMVSNEDMGDMPMHITVPMTSPVVEAMDEIGPAVGVSSSFDSFMPLPFPAKAVTRAYGKKISKSESETMSKYLKTIRTSTRGEITTAPPEEMEIMYDEDMKVEEPLVVSNVEDVDIIRNSLLIERVAERMNITAVIVDTNKNENSIQMIDNTGDPLGCYAYDAQHDGYYINCAAYYHLGTISVAYQIKVQGNKDTSNIIALPDEVIEKYFNSDQKKKMKTIRERYATPRYSIVYMQSINC